MIYSMRKGALIAMFSFASLFIGGCCGPCAVPCFMVQKEAKPEIRAATQPATLPAAMGLENFDQHSLIM
jgi:hypothetical protein